MTPAQLRKRVEQLRIRKGETADPAERQRLASEIERVLARLRGMGGTR